MKFRCGLRQRQLDVILQLDILPVRPVQNDSQLQLNADFFHIEQCRTSVPCSSFFSHYRQRYSLLLRQSEHSYMRCTTMYKMHRCMPIDKVHPHMRDPRPCMRCTPRYEMHAQI